MVRKTIDSWWNVCDVYIAGYMHIVHSVTCVSHACMCIINCIYIITLLHMAACILVGSCLATKVFIDNLPAMGRGWVIIK